MLQVPELLAPAGDMEKFDAALAYGADAIYLGGQELSLRARTKGFDWRQLRTAISRARPRGVKIYYCLNILAQERHLASAQAQLEQLAEIEPDGLIVADPGVIRLALRLAPKLPLHLSTQANTSNSQSVAFWADQGVRRVNLSRELDCRALRAVRQATPPQVELETFVHGAMCVALSGRCLMSGYLNDRSANLGACTHPCRYAYRPIAFALEEQTRPGQITWELQQDAEYATLLAADDLCLVTYLRWFQRVGLNALKIEGRMKSAGSLAQVLDAYRTGLDDLAAGRFRPAAYLAEILNASTRPFGTGFFLPQGRRRILGRGSRTDCRPILGAIQAPDGPGAWHVAVRAAWDAATDMHILVPGLERPLVRGGTYGLENERGERVALAHSGTFVRLLCDHSALRTGYFLRA